MTHYDADVVEKVVGLFEGKAKKRGGGGGGDLRHIGNKAK